MEDLHIRILKCVYRHQEGITIAEIEKELEEPEGSLKWVSEECESGGRKFWRTKKGNEYGRPNMILSMDGRAILLQHDELNQARKSSRTATYIAALALLVAIIVGIIQICTPSKLNDVQLENILESDPALELIQNRLKQIEESNKLRDSILQDINDNIKS